MNHELIKSEMQEALSQDDEIAINPSKIKRKSAHSNDRLLKRLDEDRREAKEVVSIRLDKSYADRLIAYQMKISAKRGKMLSLSKVSSMIISSFLDDEA